jgi:uncharacterized NAD(P)/FAD-binding protein YdhS
MISEMGSINQRFQGYASFQPSLSGRVVVHPFKAPVVAPGSKPAVNRLPWRQVVRQRAPRAARPRLRQLLAAGQATALLRGENVALERRMEDITAALAGLASERTRAAVANAASKADALATDAVDRIKATLAGLQPPQHPTIQEFKS